MQEIKFKVANIKCGGCAANIQLGLKAEPGVAQITVDVSSGEVEVRGDGLDPDALTHKLSALGFPLVGSLT